MSSVVADSLIDIKDNYVKYDGHKYFRRNANKIELCSHGRKQDSVLSVNYMSVSAKVARRHLENVPILSYGPIEVDWTEISEEELNKWGSVNFFGANASVANTFTHKIAIKENLKLMSFWINRNPLTKCLNRDANAVRNAMAEEGKDARIVSSILVVMDAQLAEHFSSHSTQSQTVSGTDAHLEITSGSGRVGSKTIKLAVGTTFAYGLHKVRKWRDRKSEIDQLEDDWFSFD